MVQDQELEHETKILVARRRSYVTGNNKSVSLPFFEYTVKGCIKKFLNIETE
jgi:hypothetical protein